MIETKSAGGIVVNSKGQVIVVKNQGPVWSSWSFPRGHIYEGEDNLIAAKREIYEETGIIDLELIKELGSYKRFKLSQKGEDKTEIKNITLFLFKTKTEILKPVDPENPEAKWVDKEAVVKYLTHKKDKEFFMSVIGEL